MLLFLKRIRWDHILLLLLAQLGIKYGVFEPSGVAITLNNFGIGLLVVASACIFAAGNIIINMYDPGNAVSSGMQRGKISEKTANLWYIVLTSIGILIGFYISNMIRKPGFVAIFIVISGLFYMYATYLKQIPVIKNVIPALLIAVGLLAVPVFDLLPAVTEQNRASQRVIFSIIFDYSLFACILVFIREIGKDCIMINTDKNNGISTIPIIIGRNRSAHLMGFLLALSVFMTMYYCYSYFFSNMKAVISILLGIAAPLLYAVFKSFTATNLDDFKHVVGIIKIILLLAALSLFTLKFILST